MAETQAMVTESALVELNQKLAGLIARATGLQVTDKDSCLACKTVELDLKNYLKALDTSDFARDMLAKKEAYDKSRMVLDTLSRPADTILKTIAQRRKTWEAEDEKNRKAIEDRINEENRKRVADNAQSWAKDREKAIDKQVKAGEISKKEAAKQKDIVKHDVEVAVENAPRVTVASDIPSVPGVSSRKNMLPDNYVQVTIERVTRDTLGKLNFEVVGSIKLEKVPPAEVKAVIEATLNQSFLGRWQNGDNSKTSGK